MVIDSSALIAILLVEADRDLYIEAIERGEIRLISAANALEGATVAEARKGPAGCSGNSATAITPPAELLRLLRGGVGLGL